MRLWIRSAHSADKILMPGEMHKERKDVSKFTCKRFGIDR